MKQAKLSLGILFAVFAFVTLTQAADRYWDFGSTVPTNLWSDTGNWDTAADGSGGNPGAAPGASDVAYFNVTSLNLSGYTVLLNANLSVQGLVFNTTGATSIIGVGGNRTLTLGTSGITINSGAGTVALGTTTNNQRVPIALGGSQTWLNNSANTFTLNNNNTINLGANVLTIDGSGNITTGTGVISGTGGSIVKNGAGQLQLGNGVNTFNSGITLNTGTLMLGGNQALGIGKLTITGGSVNVTAARTTTNNNLQDWNGDFTFVGGNTWDTGTGAVTMNANRKVTVSASTMTVGGAIGDGGSGYSLTKAGAGTLALNGANTYSGATTVNGGTLTVGGASGSINQSTAITNYYGTVLKIDNSTASVADRIKDTAGVTFLNTGTFNWTHAGAAGVNYTETIGALNVNAGLFTMNASQAAGGQTSAVTFASWSLASGSSALFSGSGLGNGISNQVFFTSAPTLANLVVPGVVVKRDSVFDVAGYTAGAGLHAFGTQAGEVYDLSSGATTWVAAANARPGAAVLLTGAKSVNSLTLDNGINFTGPAGDRTVTFTGGSGMILQSGGSSTIANSGNQEYIFAFGSTQAKFHTAGDLIWNRGNTVNLTGSGGLVKSGPSNLVLNISSSMTGNYYINEGTLVAGHSGALGAAGNTVILNGGTLTLAVTAATDFGADVSIDGSQSIARINLFGAWGATGVGNATHTLGVLTLGTPTQAQTIEVRSAATGPGATFNTGNNGRSLTIDSLTLAGNGTIDINGRGTYEGLFTVTGPIDNGSGGAAPYSVTKAGDGTLVLNSGANNWTGVTTVNNGVLRIGVGGNLPSGNLVLNGGYYESAAAFSRNLGSGNNQVQVLDGTSGFSAVGGSSTVTLDGGADLTWGSAYFNPTILLLGSSEQPDTVTLTLANGINLNAGASATERRIDVQNAIDTRSVITGNISGVGSLLKGSAGILELTGALSYDGTTRVIAGGLRVASQSVLPSGNLNLNPSGAAYGVLETSGTFNRAIGSGSGQVRLVGGATGDARPGFSAVGGDLTVNLGGSGATLVWDSADFDPNGPVTTTSGLHLQDANATGVLTFENGIDLNGNTATDASPWRRIGGSSTTAATRAIITGVISDRGPNPIGLQKREGSMLVLAPTSANTYSGPTQIGAGILAAVDGYGISTNNLSLLPFANNNRPTFAPLSATFTRALGTGYNEVQLQSPGAVTGSESGFTAYGQDVNVNLGGAGAEIQWGSATFSPNILLLNETMATHKLTFANGLDLNSTSARQINVRSTTASDTTAAEITGVIRNGLGGGGLTKGGTGLLILTGSNTYTGVTRINGGVLRAAEGVGLSTNSSLFLAGGVYETSGAFTWAVGTSTVQQVYRTVDNSGFSAYGGDLVIDLGGDGTGTGPKVQFGEAGVWENAGNTILNAATADSNLEWKNPISLQSAGCTAQTRTFTVNAMTATLSGNITNDSANLAGLTKAGAGTLILSGINTYNGATLVSDGTLTVNGGLLYSATTATGGTIGGTGFVGNLTIDAGQLSPGNSIGTQYAGSLTLTNIGAGALKFELGTPGASDMVIVTNASPYTGALSFTDMAASWFTLTTNATLNVGDHFTLFDAFDLGTSSLSSQTIFINIGGSGLGGYLWLDDANNNVDLIVVPEPGTGTMVGAGLMAMLMLRRLRRRR